MNTMKKRLCALLMLIVVLAVGTVQAFAAGRIETDRNITFNISYKDGTKAIPNAVFRIYKVAEVDEYAQMTLTSAFEAYKNTVTGLADLEHLTQEQWGVLARSLSGYVSRDTLVSAAEGKTDSTGKLTFSNVKPGLYLVIGSYTTTSDFYSYSATPFMVFLPGMDLKKNEWLYDVTAEPKYSKEYNPPQGDVTRKVLKKWDDAGYESLRPASVVVQLLKDGSVYDTQVLNKDNNWSHEWTSLDSNYEWNVVEKSVEGYTATISRSGVTFTITNKYGAPNIGTDLSVQKRITGDKPGTNAAFTFTLAAGTGTSPMPAGSSGTVKEITITGAGSRSFGAINFTKAGTYVYTVREKDGGVAGYTYDSTVYTVTFDVKEKNGKLTAVPSIRDGAGKAVTAIEFTNRYKTPGNKLPQTGVLWWPVPVLLCAGLAAVMIGVIRRRIS